VAPAARLRLFYLLYYGNVGAFLPYFAAYLRGLGFTGEQIGAVMMLPSLAGPAVAVGWAAWADRSAAPARALRRATAWAAACALALPFVRTPATVGAVLLAQALGDRAVIPLVDSSTLEWCRTDPAHSYARIRLFGSVGFIALTVGLGLALSARGDRPADLLVPLVAVACVAGYAAIARTLPPVPIRSGPRPGLADLRALFRDRAFLALVAACAVHWAACAPFHLLFGVFVRERGLPADVTGYGMAAGVAAEVAVLLAFPRLERRLDVPTLFAVAFAGTAVRWALTSRAVNAPEIVSLQLLHGLTFGLFWATAMKALAAAVPAPLRATGQALFSAAALGGANAAGYFLAGLGYDRFGGVAPLFAWAAALEIVPLALAWRSIKAAQP